jgi:hypothetical protein
MLCLWYVMGASSQNRSTRYGRGKHHLKAPAHDVCTAPSTSTHRHRGLLRLRYRTARALRSTPYCHCNCHCADMCWALVAEEPHRSTILNLEHCPLKDLSSSPRKDEQRKALEWPRLPLTRESRATNEHPPYHSPPPHPPFTIGKATRAHPALAAFGV